MIVGLGNPGRKYDGTRHNVGFDVRRPAGGPAPAGLGVGAGRGADRRSGGPASALLAKPLTFMNLSGEAVGELLQFYKIDARRTCSSSSTTSQLELGRLRARPSGSAGGHNGLKSLIGALGTEEFARLRIGVGRGDARRDLADHVLAKFEPDERPTSTRRSAARRTPPNCSSPTASSPVMNRFNRKEDGE